MKRLSSIVPLPLLLAACGAPEPPPSVPDPAAAQSAAPIEAVAERPDFPAVITAKNVRVVSAVFQGSLEKVFVRTRERVKKGDVIARLDTKDLKAEADSLRAQEQSSSAQATAYAATAKAAAVQAKTEARLYNRGFQSRNATISAQARFAEARGQIGAANEQAKASRVRRKQLEEQIKLAEHPSELSGIVVVLKQGTGELLPRGTPIARVFDDSDLVIRFAVPKQYRSHVKTGARVELKADGVVQPIWATITSITDQEPPITFAVVEADIDDSKLRPDEIQVATNGRVRLVDEPAPQAQPQPIAPASNAAAVTATIPATVPPIQPQPQPAQAGAKQ